VRVGEFYPSFPVGAAPRLTRSVDEEVEGVV
jgi:hypothetical protein